MTFLPITLVFFWFLAYPIATACLIMFIMTPARYILVLAAWILKRTFGMSKL